MGHGWLVFLFYGLCTIGLGVVVYITYLIIDTWTAVKSSPREEMFMCHIHGPIRKMHLIKFMEQEICPSCFHERLRNAEQGKANV